MKFQAFFTNYEFEQMARYLQLIQTSIDHQLGEIENAYNKAITEEMSDDESYLLEDIYTDKYIEAGQKYPQLLYSSFIITWYSFVEQKLLDICEDLNLVISIKPKEFINLEKGIRRARSFLIQARSYEIHPPFWDELLKIARLRNHIVHTGNRVIGSYIKYDEEMVEIQDDDGSTFFFSINKGLFDYVKSYSLASHLNIFLEIMPTDDYCHYLIDFGKKFFARLYHDLYSKRT